MKRIHIGFAVAAIVSVALAAACGSGGSSNKTPTAGSGASGATASSSGTPARSATTASTAAAGATSPAGETTPTPASGDTTLPPPGAPVSTADDNYIGGGDPNAPPVTISTIPAPQPEPGTTPVIDPTTIAPANPDNNDLSLLIDLDASQPGIQTTRDVHPGDVFRVGIVVVNAPPYANGTGGVAAFNFILNYDKTKIVAPTISGGDPKARNPRMNLPAVGGDALSWDCLPAAEGDMDDPGGVNGDGDPNTGQALLSCFTATPNAPPGPSSGTIVLGTVEFHAVATGSVNMFLNLVGVSDPLGIEYVHCLGDTGSVPPFVPCGTATVNVQ